MIEPVVGEPVQHIVCPRCEGAYFLEAKVWNAKGESLPIDDGVTNPLTLLCAHCGVCLQRIEGEWKWLTRETIEGGNDEENTTDR